MVKNKKTGSGSTQQMTRRSMARLNARRVTWSKTSHEKIEVPDVQSRAHSSRRTSEKKNTSCTSKATAQVATGNMVKIANTIKKVHRPQTGVRKTTGHLERKINLPAGTRPSTRLAQRSTRHKHDMSAPVQDAASASDEDVPGTTLAVIINTPASEDMNATPTIYDVQGINPSPTMEDAVESDIEADVEADIAKNDIEKFMDHIDRRIKAAESRELLRAMYEAQDV
jgi:hypothetical protein